jgi:hypothetical protein
MTKQKLAEMVLSEEELSVCDYAIPREIVKQKKIDTSLHMFNCKTGKLVNLADRLLMSGKLDGIMAKMDRLEHENQILRVKLNLTADQDVTNLALTGREIRTLIDMEQG